MIFQSKSQMGKDLYSSLPSTTNAQESMHSIFYQIGDKSNSLSYGFQLLILLAEHFERRSEQERVGVSTKYGKPEAWKVSIELV
jgi:hypothetical protein